MRPLYQPALCLAMLLACVAVGSAKEAYLVDKTWGSHGTANGQFDGNIGISIRGDRIYTTENDGARVQIFDLDGNFKAKFGSFGEGSGQFRAARQVVVDSLLNLFVVDSENDRVTRFNSSYVPMTAWGSDGTGNLNFKNPWRLAINPATNMLYVADMTNNRISQWTTGGNFVRTFGTYATGVLAPGGTFDHPEAVAVDAAGFVYVADYGNHRIQKFNADGVYQSLFYVGPLSVQGSPVAVAVAPNGHVFVGDGGYGTIRKYTDTGTLLDSFGSTGTGTGQFYSIDCIAVDGSGRVFVSDGSASTCRIQRFVLDNYPTAPALVRIIPKPAHDGDNLTAQVSGATDADGDTLTYRYQWYCSSNNIIWAKGPALRVLKASNTTVGQYWRVSVAAFDGKVVGPSKNSVSVRIVANAAPLTISACSASAGSGNLAVTVTLNAAAEVRATLCNLAGVPVASVSSRALDSGVNTLLVPACSDRGLKLPPGQYLLKLTADAAGGGCANCVIPVVR